MRNNKEWFSANELVGIGGLPSSPQGVNKKARTQEWTKRNREGVQGGAIEYHYSSLPLSVQQALGFLASPEAPQQPSQPDLQQRIRQLEDKLNALIGAQQATTPPDGISRKEWQLVQAYRRCNEDRKIMALSAVEALAAQTEQEQKESEEPLKDHQVA